MKPYPYAEQNNRGNIWVTGPDGQRQQIRHDPGYTRTITDQQKVIQGVSYHPYGNLTKLVRAEEINDSRRGGEDRGRLFFLNVFLL